MRTSVLAAEPLTWPDPGAMSLLDALLFFGGTTLALVAVISLLAALPSMARGTRYRPGQDWRATPSWFGGPQQPPGGGELEAGTSEERERRRLEAPTRSEDPLVEEPRRGGGAGARW